MVSQITVGVPPVIYFVLGLYFLASVMAFDMTLNTNVRLSWSMSSVPLLNICVCFSAQLAVYVLPYDDLCGECRIEL